MMIKTNRTSKGTSCHQCKSKKLINELIYCKNSPENKTRVCKKKYCCSCIQKFYSTKYTQDTLNTGQFLCPSCLNICKCALCERQTLGTNLTRRRKSPLQSVSHLVFRQNGPSSDFSLHSFTPQSQPYSPFLNNKTLSPPSSNSFFARQFHQNGNKFDLDFNNFYLNHYHKKFPLYKPKTNTDITDQERFLINIDKNQTFNFSINQLKNKLFKKIQHNENCSIEEIEFERESRNNKKSIDSLLNESPKEIANKAEVKDKIKRVLILDVTDEEKVKRIKEIIKNYREETKQLTVNRLV